MPHQVSAIEFMLPMTSTYENSMFYVRDCYPVYYQYLLSYLLNGHRVDYVSLAGSPGIGKSIFYLYFFQRFRREFPDKVIVTASFFQRQLKECAVFKSGHVVGEKFTEIPEIQGAFHLYDGAPHMDSSENKMFCFTSPNISWLKSMEKASNHRILYFPIWSLEELIDANKSLNLGLCDKELIKRYAKFGGIARHCLELDHEVYGDSLEDLEWKAKHIPSLSILENDSNTSEYFHSLFHHVPDNNPAFFKSRVCSKYVEDIIQENLNKSSKRIESTL